MTISGLFNIGIIRLHDTMILKGNKQHGHRDISLYLCMIKILYLPPGFCRSLLVLKIRTLFIILILNLHYSVVNHFMDNHETVLKSSIALLLLLAWVIM